MSTSDTSLATIFAACVSSAVNFAAWEENLGSTHNAHFPFPPFFFAMEKNRKT
jgi:hypothetical protein